MRPYRKEITFPQYPHFIDNLLSSALHFLKIRRFIIDNVVFILQFSQSEPLTHEEASYPHRLDMKLIVSIALTLTYTRRCADTRRGSSPRLPRLSFLFIGSITLFAFNCAVGTANHQWLLRLSHVSNNRPPFLLNTRVLFLSSDRERR